VPAVQDVCAQNLVTEAYRVLRSRKELKPEYQRVHSIAARCGY
jgi:hypothetical protein